MRPYGDRAFLIDCADPVGLGRAARSLAGVVDVVPGARALLVVCADAAWAAAVPAAMAELHPETVAQPETVTIRVAYDGPDLHAVAASVGVSVEELVGRHTTPLYEVAMVGFAPGFGYLRGLDAELAVVPRRAEPRATVPAGAVAIAGGWTGVYPRATPGGWQLLGQTQDVLWSLDRDPPAVLQPGTRVRFVVA